MRYLLRLALLTPMVVWIAGQASAQEASDVAQVGEVVVTARKRVETVQSVPATVQVADEAQIEKAGVVALRDLSMVSPGLNISNAPSPNQFAVTIRGLGSKPGNPSFDSSVSLFVDGVHTPRAREFASSLFDISGLETVRGTQAALLGKNTSLGALNLITKKPGLSFGGDIRYQHEFELNSDRVEGGLDIPFSESFRLRVAGLYGDEGGAVKNLIDGTRGSEVLTRAGRIVAEWDATDAVEVTAMIQAEKNRARGANAEFVSATPVPALLAARAGFPNVFEANLDYRTAIFSPSIGGAGRADSRSRRGALTVNWAVGDHTVTLQTGFTGSKTSSIGNIGFLPGDYGIQAVDDKSRQVTQEVRLVSPAGERLEYIVGALYLDGSYLNYTRQGFDFPPAAPGAPAVGGLSTTIFDQNNQAWSVFGQANYRITDPLQVTVGLRYTKEDKDVDLQRVVLRPGIYSLVVNPPYAPFSLSRSEDNVDASVGVNYQVASDVLIYASWGRGTKAGGFAQAASLLDRSGYEPEVAETVEAGFKARFDDRRWTVNAAVFRTEVEDFQLVTFTGTNFDVRNTDLRSTGLETQIIWAPIRGASVFWNNTYAETRDTRNGGPASFAPLWSGAAGGAYRWEILPGLEASFDLNVEYRSSQTSQDVGVVVPRLKASTRWNASFGIAHLQQGWDLRLIGKNLNDEHILGFVFPAPLLPPGNAVGLPLNPRTVMLQLGYRF